jgi:hypothetical protein
MSGTGRSTLTSYWSLAAASAYSADPSGFGSRGVEDHRECRRQIIGLFHGRRLLKEPREAVALNFLQF